MRTHTRTKGIVFGALLLLGMVTLGWSEIFSIPEAFAQPSGAGGLARDSSFEAGLYGSLLKVSGYIMIFLQVALHLAIGLVEPFLDPQVIFQPNIEMALRWIWVLSRNITNAVFAILLFLAAVKMVVMAKLASITDVKEKMPRFVMAVILVNFSWFIPRVIIDAANITAMAIFKLPAYFDTVAPCKKPVIDGSVASALWGECVAVGYTEIFPEKFDPNDTTPGAPYRDADDLCTEKVGPAFLAPAGGVPGILVACYVPWSAIRNNNGSNGIINGLASNFAHIGEIAKLPKQAPPSAGVTTGDTTRQVIIFALKTLFAVAFHVAVALPLLALAVVLIMRMGVLWFTIAFMPFTFIGLVLTGKLTTKFGSDNTPDLWEHFLGAALLPVKIAIPFSVAFIMVNVGNSMGSLPLLHDTVGIPQGLFANFSEFSLFIWYVTTLVIMWTGTFKALESTGEFGAKIAGTFKGFGSTLLRGAKDFALLTPLPIGKGTSIGGLMQAGKDVMRLPQAQFYKDSAQITEDVGKKLGFENKGISGSDLAEKIAKEPLKSAALGNALRNGRGQDIVDEMRKHEYKPEHKTVDQIDNDLDELRREVDLPPDVERKLEDAGQRRKLAEEIHRAASGSAPAGGAAGEAAGAAPAGAAGPGEPPAAGIVPDATKKKTLAPRPGAGDVPAPVGTPDVRPPATTPIAFSRQRKTDAANQTQEDTDQFSAMQLDILRQTNGLSRMETVERLKATHAALTAGGGSKLRDQSGRVVQDEAIGGRKSSERIAGMIKTLESEDSRKTLTDARSVRAAVNKGVAAEFSVATVTGAPVAREVEMAHKADRAMEQEKFKYRGDVGEQIQESLTAAQQKKNPADRAKIVGGLMDRLRTQEQRQDLPPDVREQVKSAREYLQGQLQYNEKREIVALNDPSKVKEITESAKRMLPAKSSSYLGQGAGGNVLALGSRVERTVGGLREVKDEKKFTDERNKVLTTLDGEKKKVQEEQKLVPEDSQAGIALRDTEKAIDTAIAAVTNAKTGADVPAKGAFDAPFRSINTEALESKGQLRFVGTRAKTDVSVLTRDVEETVKALQGGDISEGTFNEVRRDLVTRLRTKGEQILEAKKHIPPGTKEAEALDQVERGLTETIVSVSAFKRGEITEISAEQTGKKLKFSSETVQILAGNKLPERKTAPGAPLNAAHQTVAKLDKKYTGPIALAQVAPAELLEEREEKNASNEDVTAKATAEILKPGKVPPGTAAQQSPAPGTPSVVQSGEKEQQLIEGRPIESVADVTTKDTVDVLKARIERTKAAIANTKKDIQGGTLKDKISGVQKTRENALKQEESTLRKLETALSWTQREEGTPQEKLDTLKSVRTQIGLPEIPKALIADYDRGVQATVQAQQGKTIGPDYQKINKELADLDATLGKLETGLKVAEQVTDVAGSAVATVVAPGYGGEAWAAYKAALNTATGRSTPEEAAKGFATSVLTSKLTGGLLKVKGADKMIAEWAKKNAARFSTEAVQKLAAGATKAGAEYLPTMGVENVVKSSVDFVGRKGNEALNGGEVADASIPSSEPPAPSPSDPPSIA